MTLYRIDDDKADELYASFTGGLPDPLWLFIEDGVLVEVEPCLHGNYDRHIKPSDEWAGDWPMPVSTDWCPGAGIGDTQTESIRDWATRQGVSLDSIRNAEYDDVLPPHEEDTK